MANEHSIRVSASGEFGQLERGLKNLQKDLNGVLGEIDKGARSGGLFDDTQLRALDLYRGRFKGTMDELNREFTKQNDIVDALHRKKETASRDEQANIDKEIRGREKQLDIVRRQTRATEDLYSKRNKESTTYGSKPATGTSTSPSTATGGTSGGSPAGGAGSSLVGAAGASVLGAGKFVAGLAGIAGIASMASEAYNLAYQSQVTPLNLSQRMRGNGYSGSAKNMWDEVGEVGRRDQMGYTSAESWDFQDQYSRQAGTMSPTQMEEAMKFGRGYGLEVGETTSSLSAVRELGGSTSPSEFADMIAASVGKSGMTPRILEVMQTSAGLLASMNTSLKDTGAKQILAYQTTLDTIGMEKGMMKLTGEQGANVIGGLGGIFTPEQENPWKYMGMQALQSHDPSKYGQMGMFDLEKTFEDGLMNPDNLPAMAGYLKDNSGGDKNLELRMLQKWLQDGGYNATKRQTSELYDATNGLTAFDEDKMKGIMKELEGGDGTAKYQERVGQLGQEILDVNSRFEKQLENLGQPILEMVTGLKSGITDILEELNDGGISAILENIRDFLEDNWGLLATALGIAGLAALLAKMVPDGKDSDGGKNKNNAAGGGKGNGDNDDNNNNRNNDNNNNNNNGNNGNNGGGNDGGGGGNGGNDGGSSPKVVPIVPGGALARMGIFGAIGAGLYGTGKGFLDTFQPGDKDKHESIMEKNGYSKEEIEDNGFFDRLATNVISGLSFGSFTAEDQYKMGSPENGEKVDKGLSDFVLDIEKLFNPQANVPKTEEYLKLQKLNDEQTIKRAEEPWYEPVKQAIPDSWGDSFKGMRDDFYGLVNESFGTDWGGEKRDAALETLVNLGNNGQVALGGMSEHGKIKLQELTDEGLVKLEAFNVNGYTAINGMSESGKAQLQLLQEEGLISIDGLQADGTTSISALSEEGKARLQELKDKGEVTFDEWYTGTSATLSGFTDDGKSQLKKLQEQGLISIGGFEADGTAQITALSEQGREELEILKKDGGIQIGEFSEDGRMKITSLSEKGAEELLELQKNGSLSMDGMDETTDAKLSKVSEDTKSSMDEIESEHKSWSDKLIGKGGIFTKLAVGAMEIFDSILDTIEGWNFFGMGESTTGMGGAYEGKYADLINENATKNGLDPNLVAALIKQESGFDTNATSHAGAMGLMQLMPGTARGLGVNNAYDAEQNVEGGTKYLADLMKRYNGNVEHALTAYNWGQGNMDAYLKTGRGINGQARPKESLEYAKKVMANYDSMNKTATGGGDFFKGWDDRVTSRWGDTAGRKSTHRGLDINGDQGDPIQAMTAGIISHIKMDDGGKYDPDGKKNSTMGGNEIGVRMSNGETYFYAHMAKIDEKIKQAYFGGQKNIAVQKGQYLGNVGGDRGMSGSGYSTTGSHLHLGYMDKNGNLKDPMSLMNRLFGGRGDSDTGILGGIGDSDTGTTEGGVQSLDNTRRSLGDVIRQMMGGTPDMGDSSTGTDLMGTTDATSATVPDTVETATGNRSLGDNLLSTFAVAADFLDILGTSLVSVLQRASEVFDKKVTDAPEDTLEEAPTSSSPGFASDGLLGLGRELIDALNAFPGKFEVGTQITDTPEAIDFEGIQRTEVLGEAPASEGNGLLELGRSIIDAMRGIPSSIGVDSFDVSVPEAETVDFEGILGNAEAPSVDVSNDTPVDTIGRAFEATESTDAPLLIAPETVEVSAPADPFTDFSNLAEGDLSPAASLESQGLNLEDVIRSITAADPSVKKVKEEATTKTLNVNVTIEGGGAQALNEMTLLQLKNFVVQVLTEKEQMTLAMNPTTGGY